MQWQRKKRMYIVYTRPYTYHQSRPLGQGHKCMYVRKPFGGNLNYVIGLDKEDKGNTRTLQFVKKTEESFWEL